jgi:hypothetical protein
MAPWRIPARVAAAVVAAVIAGASARAADLFTVSGVTVDATAESAQAAQQQALAKGQRIALAAMFSKLTLEVDHARLPASDAETLARLVRGFEVTDERRSSLRYIAELTVRFDPEGVRAALRDAGIPYAETESLPILVLPLLDDRGEPRLWAEPNPWRAAWRALDWRNRLVDLVLPYGELADLTTITAEQALAGDERAIAAIAARYDAADSLVAVARPLADGMLEVEARRFGPAGSEVVYRQRIAPAPAQAALATAAAAIAQTLERAWKRDNLLDFRRRERIEVTVSLSGLEGWLELRRRLEALSQITRIEVAALTTTEARLRLHYLGDAERLADALQRRSVELVEESPGAWRLELRLAAPAPETAPVVLPADPEQAFAAPPAPGEEAREPASPADDLLFE